MLQWWYCGVGYLCVGCLEVVDQGCVVGVLVFEGVQVGGVIDVEDQDYLVEEMFCYLWQQVFVCFVVGDVVFVQCLLGYWVVQMFVQCCGQVVGQGVVQVIGVDFGYC